MIDSGQIVLQFSYFNLLVLLLYSKSVVYVHGGFSTAPYSSSLHFTVAVMVQYRLKVIWHWKLDPRDSILKLETFEDRVSSIEKKGLLEYMQKLERFLRKQFVSRRKNKSCSQLKYYFFASSIWHYHVWRYSKVSTIRYVCALKHFFCETICVRPSVGGENC